MQENQRCIPDSKGGEKIENINFDSQYSQDKENIENFLSNKSETFDVFSLKRLVLSELSYKGAFRYNKICGFTRRQIQNMIQYPERYGKNIIRLSRYMYLKSGYYKRLIDYFVNMAVVNWTVDLEPKTIKAYSPDEKMIKQIRTNYYKYVAQVNKFKIDNRITDIVRKMFVEDACFGYIVENEIESSIYFLDAMYCEIKKNIGGNVFGFSVNRSLIGESDYETIPLELQELLEDSKEVSLNNMVEIPYEKSICLKYHNDFSYLYSPFLGLINEILNIDDFKDISKSKAESDAYKLIYMKIPLNEDGKITMGDEMIVPFVSMCKNIVPENFGVVPSPMPLELIESKSTANDDKNNVETAVENYYTEAGISKALISSASSGSELKSSIKVDSSDIYRIYRQIEAWMELQMKLRGYIYTDYQFTYNISPTTIFDISDYIDMQLKLAQVSSPNKGKLLAANGINTAKMLGNTLLENNVLSTIFDSWKPLASTYTMSGNSEAGRPQMSEDELSESGIQTRQDDTNNKANRDI